MITINITKAKEIAKDVLRTERQPVLQKLDIEFQKALETGNTELQTSVVEQKQTLRDITNHSSITNAKTVEKLKTSMNTLVDEIKAQ
jgi:hypothetical protein